MSWIKLPRSIMKSPVFENPRTLKVWLWCRIRAGHRPTVVNMVILGKSKAVHLNTGEFIYSRKNGAKETQLPVTTFGRELLKLEQMGHIKVTANQYYSVMRLLVDVEQPKAKPKAEQKTNTLKNARSSTNTPLSATEVEEAITQLQKEQLPKLMADLYIYSHPDTIRQGYQSHLQKQPKQFVSLHDVQAHLQQYLLREWA